MALQDCRWFKEGVAARGENAPCPYGGGSPKAILWLEGYESGQAPAVTPAVVIAPAVARDPDDLPEIGIDS